MPPRGVTGTGLLSRLAALAATLPLVFALTTHHDAERIGWNVALWTLIGVIFLAAQFTARQVVRFPGGSRLVAAFAVLNLVLGMLGFASAERFFTLAQAAADLGLLYLVFFVAAAATRISGALGRVLLALLVIVLALTAIVQAVHVHTFGFAIGPEGYRAILQSNPGEVFEFVGRFVGAGALATALTGLTVALAAAFGACRAAARAALGWAAVFGLAAFGIARDQRAARDAAREGLAAAAYVIELVEYRRAPKRAAVAHGLAIPQQGPLAGQPQTYVFIVGESLTRNHMPLYGYWRETTPALARLARRTGGVHRRGLAALAHRPLARARPYARESGQRPELHRPRELQPDRAAARRGLQTWWISNQNSFGPWDNKTAALGARPSTCTTPARARARSSGAVR